MKTHWNRAKGYDASWVVVVVIAALCVLAITQAHAGLLDETRYCGTPARNADGSIKRSSAVLSAFQKIHPCPSTGASTGPCNWEIDHVIPLSVGGCDSVSNLQWLPPAIKRCSGKLCKDRWERRVYDNPVRLTDAPSK